MVRIDRTQRSNFQIYPAGQYLIEVSTAELKRTKEKGIPYFNLRLVAVEDEGNPTVCFDMLMLGGEGLNITNAKLDALGFSESDADLAAEDFIGRRAWIAVKEEEWQGDTRTKVDIRAKGFKCGYRAANDPPTRAADSYEVSSSPLADLSPTAKAKGPKSIEDEEGMPF